MASSSTPRSWRRPPSRACSTGTRRGSASRSRNGSPAAGARRSTFVPLRRTRHVARRVRSRPVPPAVLSRAVTVRVEPSILHVDLDAFYASVEQLHDPTLRGRPVLVGRLGPRGVGRGRELRSAGVQCGIHDADGARPPAVPAGYHRGAAHGCVRRCESCRHGDPPRCHAAGGPIALDEAFLDIAGTRRRLGDPRLVGNRIHAEVLAATRVVASVGAATTKLVAKLASDEAKPNGLLVVEPGDALAFLHALPVQRLWGVGPATRTRLAGLGGDVGDLAALPQETVVGALGARQGAHLHTLAWNRDERAVEPNRETKSVGHEETFPRTSTTARCCAARSCASPRAWAPGCTPPGWRDARCRSRSAFRTSGPSPGRAPCRAHRREHGRHHAAAELLGASIVRGHPPAGVSVHGCERAWRWPRPCSRPGPRPRSSILRRRRPGPDAGRQGAAERAADEARARFGAGAVTRAVLAPSPPGEGAEPASR